MAKPCEICGRRTSRYICQECGRAVCEACMEPETWLCLDCYKRISPPEVEFKELAPPFPPVLKLFIVSFMLIFFGVIVLMLTAILSGLTKASGIVVGIIGPIPIIFGLGENLMPLLIIATILTIICIIAFVMLSRRK
ncbi:MAG: hypothetical protein QXJ19_00640 [Candidatus Bathyarchaeia archaeon]|nr:DUF131 domain-containing protein [Candidatus Bathyarchaeota archaeon]